MSFIHSKSLSDSHCSLTKTQAPYHDLLRSCGIWPPLLGLPHLTPHSPSPVFQPQWLSLFNKTNSFFPRGLRTWYLVCLKNSSPGFLHGWFLLILPVLAQTSSPCLCINPFNKYLLSTLHLRPCSRCWAYNTHVCVGPPRSRHPDRIRRVRDLFGEIYVKDKG